MNPTNFFAELKRRNVYKVAVAYAVVGWLLLQAASILFPTFEAPPWVMKVFVAVIAAGFPVALLLAWAFELTPAGLKRTEEVAPDESIAPVTGRKLNLVIILVLATVIGLLVFDRFRGGRVQPHEVGIKSIAVLPFENFSDDRENAFFADGIQDDILTSLARIHELKVISRTSVMGYRGGAPRNLREIARALDVTNVLEGSVRRVSNRVLVNVQLIDAVNDRHIWADRYDRTIQDAIALQGELATEIAAALRATLSPEEKARVATKPTDNAEAYTWYLKGTEIDQRPDISPENYRESEEAYTRAVKLDPKFALAHAKLAFTIAATYHEFNPTEDLARRARAEADEALRLNPDLADAHSALSHWYYWIKGDYETALGELAIAEKLSPNNVDVPSGKAAIRRRQGRWREALREFARAESLDPRNGSLLQEVAFTHFCLRDWTVARATAERIIAVAPTSPTGWMFRAFTDYFERGDVAAAQQIFAKCPRDAAGHTPVEFVPADWEFAMLRRDFKVAEEVLARSSYESFAVPSGPPISKAYLAGCLALARGDTDRGRAQFEQARVQLEQFVRESPNDASRHAALGLVLAFLGQKEDALREGQRGMELTPETKDALLGAAFAANMALICTQLGEMDKAITLLERLISTPAAIGFVDGSVSLQDLRLRWQWDPLRGDERFQKLVNGPEVKTVY